MINFRTVLSGVLFVAGIGLIIKVRLDKKNNEFIDAKHAETCIDIFHRGIDVIIQSCKTEEEMLLRKQQIETKLKSYIECFGLETVKKNLLERGWLWVDEKRIFMYNQRYFEV